MSWMLTNGGRQHDLRMPQAATIHIDDIAHALSLINRFTGHTRRPYSVAEHSVLVMDICRHEMALDVHGQLAALLHDAHEAYSADLSAPAKREVGEGWVHFEERQQRAVRSAFGLHQAAYHAAAAIRRADLIALATERAQLMPLAGPPWEALLHIQPVGWVDLNDRGRASLSWQDWRGIFRDRFDELEFARTVGLHPVTQP